MKPSEMVYRELLYRAIEKRSSRTTQSELSKSLHLSLGTVNYALKPLRKLGAVEVGKRSLSVADVKKLLYFWASIRNVGRDIVYSTRADMPVYRIEKLVPSGTIFTAYTAYKMRFKDVAADYSEVYVYGDSDLFMERFAATKQTPNLFVLRKDKCIDAYGQTATLANMFVDLWNMKEWYAREFVNAMEGKLHGFLE
ncbi:winged helix-turn-helix domain-containing protein [Candidatus Woesearchaeota archaeon]|nr:winged helix-turn-helix domain-containing protein [Candidatus Woesearchaeota archaeon]